MRIKLLKENFCHNKLLSILIILCASCISILMLLALEMNNYLIFANIENSKYQYNNYDIVISSNIPLSLNGINKYEDKELNNYYQNVSSFYSTTLMVKSNKIEQIINIIETDEEDYNNLFKLNNIPNKGEAVITDLTAKSLNVEVNDEITIYLKDKTFNYKIIDIIKADKCYNGKYILIGGRNITYEYGIQNIRMPNNIVINLNNENDAEFISNYLLKSFNFCNVTNLLDKEIASRQNVNTIPTICIICAIVFIMLLFILCHIYQYRLRKQKEVFINYKMINYFNQIQLIEWIIIFIISFILSGVLTNFILSLFNPIFNVNNIFITNIISIFISSLTIFIIPIFFMLRKIKIKISNKTKYLFITLFFILTILLSIFIKNIIYKDLFIVISTIIGCILIISLLLELTKNIKPLLHRTFLYNLNKNNPFVKLLILVQLSMMVCLCLIISTMDIYKKSLNEIDEFINIDTIVTTTSKANISTKYEHIKVASNVLIENNEIDYLLSLNIDQLDKYSNIELNDNEKEEFENNKSIILPKYYSNKFNYNIGDIITLNINGKEEEFKIIKFLKRLQAGVIIVNNSVEMYDAYIIDNNIPVSEVINDFSNTTYFIVDVETSVIALSSLHSKLLIVINTILLFIMLILIVFSLYIFNLNFLYKKDTFIKLKNLGLNNSLWKKLSLIKIISLVLICFILGFILEIIIINRLDNILKIFNTILQLEYTFMHSVLSISIIIVNAVIGYFVNNKDYKKI